MKKKYTHLFIIFIFLFTSCFTIPGYVDKDGNITPQYIKEIKIEVIKGNVSIIPFETSKGILNKIKIKFDILLDFLPAGVSVITSLLSSI